MNLPTRDILSSLKSLKTVSVGMSNAEIDLMVLKNAVNAIVDHLMGDLGIQKVKIEEGEDCHPRINI